MFVGLERGAERAAVVAALIMTAMLSDAEPHAPLADVLARMAGYHARHLADPLPWRWHPRFSGLAEISRATWCWRHCI